MEKLLGEYKSYLLQSRGPEEVKMELDAKLEKMTEYKPNYRKSKLMRMPRKRL